MNKWAHQDLSQPDMETSHMPTLQDNHRVSQRHYTFIQGDQRKVHVREEWI
jgi:hypothetical protein